MIIFTRLIPAKFDAVTIWPFIFIRPGKNTLGLFAHEMTHYRAQAWITPIWLLRYALSKSFRLDAEVTGYQAQIDIGAISVDVAAKMLMEYRLGLSYNQAVAILAEGLP